MGMSETPLEAFVAPLAPPLAGPDPVKEDVKNGGPESVALVNRGAGHIAASKDTGCFFSEPQQFRGAIRRPTGTRLGPARCPVAP